MSLTATYLPNSENTVTNDDTPQHAFSGGGSKLLESRKNSIMEFLRLESIRSPRPTFPVNVISTSRKPLRDTLAKIHKLLSWGPNWNGYDMLAPNPDAIIHAERWIVNLFQTVEELNLLWIKPSITASPEGDVVFEWRHDKKKLTIYVGPRNVDYVQVWGTDIHAKITDGDIESLEDAQLCWMWLVS